MHFQDWNVKINMLFSVHLNSFQRVVWNSLVLSLLHKSKLIVLYFFFLKNIELEKCCSIMTPIFFPWYIYEFSYNHLICFLFVMSCMDFFLNHEAPNSPPFFVVGHVYRTCSANEHFTMTCQGNWWFWFSYNVYDFLLFSV